MKSKHPPVFVICTGRSGSTLLQYLLDAHEQIEAPQELHLGPMIKEMIKVTNRLYEGRVPPDQSLSQVVSTEVRRQVDDLLRSTLQSDIWCDKSVSSIDYLDEITRVFPDARFIFLYRDCLDFVHSALEVSKYGFEGFGFEKEILKTPENIVEGLVRFWCLQTEKRLDIEAASNLTIHRICYEDIVHNTLPAMNRLFAFLDLDFREELLIRAFSRFKPGRGDLKVQSLGGIVDHTGKGRNIPLKHISATTFERMNHNLRQLGYPEIDADHNYNISNQQANDSLASYALEKVTTFLNSRLTKNTIPSELKGLEYVMTFPDLMEDSIYLNVGNDNVTMIPVSEQKNAIELKMRMDTFLRLMDGNLNISMAYRDGLVQTNGSYSQLNEIGKFLFG